MHKTPPTRPFLLVLATALALGGAALAGAADAIRIRAGTTKDHTDENGVVWLADQGFRGGETIDRTGIRVANTPTPSLYTAERYSMSGFSQAVPNGKYTVKLHFAETYEGISGKGERVFSFNVEGREFQDFDVAAKAGGVMRAYVETVEVEVKDGRLDITFTHNIENPAINALEIIPAS
ncbi:MAG: malectin [Verrucomicrobiota bacterium]